ncbi:MAG: DNA repair protein RecO [Myxococcota bacterium]
MKEARTRAYLLRAVDYRDADRIVTLLTHDHGCISAVARSARRSRKRFGGSLEGFMKLDVGLKFRRSDLATLTDATVVEPHPGILADLRRIRAAGAGLELVRLVAPERQPDPELFAAVGVFLTAMSDAESNGAATLALAFCGHVVSLVGWTPDLDHCGVTGRRCPAAQAAYFDPGRGTIVSRDGGGGPVLLSGVARAAWKRSFVADWVPEAPWDAEICREVGEAIYRFIAAQTHKELSDAWRSALLQ